MILHVLLLCAFAVATTEFILVGLLPDIATDLAVSLPTAGLLVTAYMLVVTVGGPAAAVITRRLPRRGLLAGTMALALASAALSASAHTYALLLGARLGSALAQALFVAVASQVAMAAVPPVRQTAAVARVFNGFALATVIGLPAGTFVGQLYGWHAAFLLVALLSAAGLAGILVFCPAIPQAGADPLADSITVMLRPTVLLGLLTTMLALTGFVAAFTYVAPTLHEVAGLPDVGVTLALLVYGAGTIAGTALAGRIQPAQIARVLPLPLASLAVVLVTQGLLMQQPATAALSLFLMGGSAFVVVPLLQTWLMGEVGPAAAGIAAAMNISVAGLATAVGASLGAAVIATGLGLAWIGPSPVPCHSRRWSRPSSSAARPGAIGSSRRPQPSPAWAPDEAQVPAPAVCGHRPGRSARREATWGGPRCSHEPGLRIHSEKGVLTTMYAVVRDNRYDPAKLAQGQAQLEEFQALHDRQPGALGTLVVDAGDHRWITINLWDSQEHAAAALPGLVPEVQRLIEPLLAAPSQLIAAGPVRVDTVTARQDSRAGGDAPSSTHGAVTDRSSRT